MVGCSVLLHSGRPRLFLFFFSFPSLAVTTFMSPSIRLSVTFPLAHSQFPHHHHHQNIAYIYTLMSYSKEGEQCAWLHCSSTILPSSFFFHIRYKSPFPVGLHYQRDRIAVTIVEIESAVAPSSVDTGRLEAAGHCNIFLRKGRESCAYAVKCANLRLR